MHEKEQAELIAVIADFLEMGHVENIMAMFKQDTSLYALSGELLRDERFMVRMGMAVLFEELKAIRPQEVALAIPALLPVLAEETPWMRGEAVNLLGIIGTPEALAHIKPLADDPEPQIREMVADILAEAEAFSLPRSLLLFLPVRPQTQLGELFSCHCGRGVGERAGCLLGLGEGDDIADGVAAQQDHHQAVQTKGHAAMGRCAKLKRLDQKVELVGHLLLGNAQGGKDPFLHLLLVDTDGAAADLGAV